MAGSTSNVSYLLDKGVPVAKEIVVPADVNALAETLYVTVAAHIDGGSELSKAEIIGMLGTCIQGLLQIKTALLQDQIHHAKN